MPYYISKRVEASFDDAIARTRQALAAEDFGVVNEFDAAAFLRQRLDTDFRAYLVLGACHAQLTFDALAISDKVGPLLPCNVIVQDAGGGFIEVAAIDPAANMHTVSDTALRAKAQIVGRKLRAAVARV